MAFTDLNFLSRFLPLFLIIYFLLPRRMQLPALFAGSLIFYTMGDWRHLPLLLLLCWLNFVFAKMVWEDKSDDGRHRRQILLAIAGMDAGVLVLFKIMSVALGMALPLGISFYIFKMLSFQADLYQGKITQKPSMFTMAAYFSLFFQVAQGPIMRYTEEEFAKPHRLSLIKIEEGLKYLIIGLAMKVLVADRLAILWHEAVKIGFESLSTPLAWLAAVGYSLELYLDFWGYSLMAAGIGVMLGFSFVENFRHPYAATSVGEFYRRWHITLTSWFKDYVYIPLGGSRKGKKRTIVNILLVWLLTGFWHGGGLHFILWGLVLGGLILWEKFIGIKWLQKYPAVGHMYVIVLIPLTWMCFAVGNMSELSALFSRLLPLSGQTAGADPNDFVRYLSRFWTYICAGIALCVPKVYEFVQQKRDGKARLVEAAILVLLLWISLYSANSSKANPVLYLYF